MYWTPTNPGWINQTCHLILLQKLLKIAVWTSYMQFCNAEPHPIGRKPPGGGGTDLERGIGMCRGHDPLFSGHPALLSLPMYHHCAALMPPFSNFRKNFQFQPCFGQNFSSQDANFPNFRSLDPSFFKENPLPRPYFWKPVWHTPTKKKLSAPPGRKPGDVDSTVHTHANAWWKNGQSQTVNHGTPQTHPQNTPYACTMFVYTASTACVIKSEWCIVFLFFNTYIRHHFNIMIIVNKQINK